MSGFFTEGSIALPAKRAAGGASPLGLGDVRGVGAEEHTVVGVGATKPSAGAGRGDDEDDTGGPPRSKLGLPAALAESAAMQALRGVLAKDYGRKMAALETVNVLATRSLGLMCRMRDGHAAPVTALAFADDGNLLASGAADGLCVVWDLEEQSRARALDEHAGAITGLCWCPSRARNELVTTSADGTAKLWDVDRGTVSLTLRDHAPAAACGAAYSADGDMLATCGGSGLVVVYDAGRIAAQPAQARRNIHSMLLLRLQAAPAAGGGGGGAVVPGAHGPGPVHKVAWSRDAAFLATAGEDGTARVWRLLVLRQHGAGAGGSSAHHACTLEGHGGPVVDVAFDPLGERLLTASADGTARVWAFRPAAAGDDDGAAPEAGAAAAAAAAEVQCLRVLGRGGVHSGPLSAAIFTAEGGGRRVLTAGRADGLLVLWEASSGTPLQVLAGLHGGGGGGVGSITALAGRPDALQVATGGSDRTVGVWRAIAPALGETVGRALWAAARVLCCLCFCVHDEAEAKAAATDPSAAPLSSQGKGKRGRGSGGDDEDEAGGGKVEEEAAADASGATAAAVARKASRRAKSAAALQRHRAAAAGAGRNTAAGAGSDDDDDDNDDDGPGRRPHRGGGNRNSAAVAPDPLSNMGRPR